MFLSIKNFYLKKFKFISKNIIIVAKKKINKKYNFYFIIIKNIKLFLINY